MVALFLTEQTAEISYDFFFSFFAIPLCPPLVLRGVVQEKSFFPVFQVIILFSRDAHLFRQKSFFSEKSLSQLRTNLLSVPLLDKRSVVKFA